MWNEHGADWRRQTTVSFAAATDDDDDAQSGNYEHVYEEPPYVYDHVMHDYLDLLDEDVIEHWRWPFRIIWNCSMKTTFRSAPNSRQHLHLSYRIISSCSMTKQPNEI